MSVLELFCHVDDFCRSFEPVWHAHALTSGTKQRNRARELALSEIMTILILFHQSHYRTFKAFYTEHVCVELCGEFPHLVSYTRFVEFFPSALVPLVVYLYSCLGSCTGVSFIDSTRLAVCHNRRIRQHRVFRGLAERGKTSVDWFFGFKLHLVFNDQGELLTLLLTPGNVDDRAPVPAFAKQLFGKLFGDKGYLSAPLVKQLNCLFGCEVTPPRRNNRPTGARPRRDLRIVLAPRRDQLDAKQAFQLLDQRR